ncbi:MAG: hypothetical protein H0T68_10300 [Gemmatimonadales bacterium]|nr:hypothetical protein [Gemmatimonadales bacterium]
MLPPYAKVEVRNGRPVALWLRQEMLHEAQTYLGAATERAAVEMALDLVAFRKELGDGARALQSLRLRRLG